MVELAEAHSYPQAPDIPWQNWVGRTLATLRFFREPGGSTLAEPLRIISHEIPFSADFRQIRQKNAALIAARSGASEGTFYRPGLGYGWLLSEIFEHAGTFREMVVTDQVYADQKMREISGGLLPLVYYFKTLQLVQARDIEVKVARDLMTPVELVHPEAYEEAVIPRGGKGQIDFRLNGVNLKISLFTADMTRFWPPNYQILGLGNPRPAEVGVTDPRYSLEFRIKALGGLAIGGILDYSETGIYFLPPKAKPKDFGLKRIWQWKERVVYQKEKPLPPDKLKSLFEAIGKFPIRARSRQKVNF